MTVAERQIVELLTQILAELQRITKYAKRIDKRAARERTGVETSDADEA
jgi:uncharacterized protein with HEPN domain